jgi:hypothetical protein
MTDNNSINNSLTPTNRDRAAAWRLVMALLEGDHNAVVHVAREAQTAHDVDRLLLALASNTAMFLSAACPDPIAYVEKAVAFELDEQAEQHGQGG